MINAKQKEAVERLLKEIDPGEQMWNNGLHKITPLHLIDSIQTAQDNISFSNYDCSNLDRVLTLAMMYCKEHNITLGDYIPETLNLSQYEE